MDRLSEREKVENLLEAPYLFKHSKYKRMYEKCENFLYKTDVYQCNFCHIKILTQSNLLKHNQSFEHQNAMQKEIEEMYEQSIANNGTAFIAYSEPAKKMLRQAALQTSKMKLFEAIAELKQYYETYRDNPVLHPMYAKEWQVFYLRRLSDLLADNRDARTYDFTEDWSSYWVQRVQVYYNKSLKQIIDAVGSNYMSTVDELAADPKDEPTPPQINAEAFVLESDATTVTDSESKSESSEGSAENNDNKVIDMELETDTDSDSSDDGMTSCLQTACLEHLEDMVPANTAKSEDNWPTTIPPNDNEKQQIDNEAVADQVLSLFHSFEMNPDKLTDEQIESYIKYVVKIQADNAKNGSIETISVHSSDYSIEL